MIGNMKGNPQRHPAAGGVRNQHDRYDDIWKLSIFKHKKSYLSLYKALCNVDNKNLDTLNLI